MNHAKTQICLVRHGETTWNAAGRLQGSQDTPLSSTGEAQAMHVAKRLAKEGPWEAVYSSQLKRAVVTAEIIAKTLHVAHKLDVRLQERSYGIFEGKTLSEIDKEYPGLLPIRDQAVPGMERLADTHSRITACLEELAHEFAGKRTVVVSHGAAIKSFLEPIVGEAVGFLGNTSVTLLTKDDKGWTPVLLNDTSHLPDLTSEGLA